MNTTTRHDNDKRVVRTKKAIKAALFKIMETKDISAITISELTAEANVNRRTFYTHYRNITDILNEIESDLVAALRELADNFDTSDYEKSTYELFLGLDRLITVDFQFYFHLVRVDMRGILVSRLKTVIKKAADAVLEQFADSGSADSAVLSAFLAGGFFNAYLDYIYNPNRSQELSGRSSLEHSARLAASAVAFCIKNARTICHNAENAQ